MKARGFRLPMLLAAVAGFALALTVAPPAAAGQGTGHGHPKLFVAVLTGAAEPNGGDADGIGLAVFRLPAASGRLCYLLAAAKLDGTVAAAHIHRAPAGVNGPIVVPLEPPVDGVSKACTTIDPALAAAIVADPAGYYVNVHTSAFPGGAVRSQLR